MLITGVYIQYEQSDRKSSKKKRHVEEIETEIIVWKRGKMCVNIDT